MEAKNRTNGEYQRLLVTHGPIEALAGHVRWSTLPFDNMAMTFTTYKKESLWDKPFTIVEKIGPVDADAHVVVVDNLSCEYEPCPLQDVIRLLEKPIGPKPAHARVDPLESAHQTAAAFRLLLQEQLKNANASRPESERLP
jgi:hypothetical protein